MFDNSTSKNFQYSTVAIAPSPPLSGTSLSVQPTNGVEFAEAPFWAFVGPPESQLLGENTEVIRVTAKSGDKFTIERAQQGSKAQQIATGWVIFAGDSSAAWEEVHEAIEGEITRAKAAEKAAEEGAVANAATKATAAKTEAEAAATSKVKTEEEARKAEVKTEKERAEAVEALKAPLASPALTGTPKAPTAPAKTNTEQLATTAFAQMAKGEAEAASVPLSSKGKASGVAELDGGGKLPETELPVSVVSGSQYLLSIANYGAESGKDCTAAIEAAQKAAEKLPGCAGVWFPEGTWEYTKTLLIRVPWYGVPRKSILKRTSTFTYEGLESQFSVLNLHASTTYNASTADTVIIRGIDFEIEGTEVAGKGALGLANVAGGEISDCHFKTNGTNVVNALIDLYACVKNFKLDVQCANTTQAKTGGNVWIRNLAAKPEEATQTTENIYISPRSRFLTTTGDEAIAVYGVYGVVKNVLIDGATIEAGASTEKHQRLASTFPSAIAEKPNAAVENVEWRQCTFIDTEGTIKENGEVLGIGRGTGTTYLCQNIRHVDCTFRIKTTATKVVATRNIPSKYEGEASGIIAVNPYVNAEGSTEPVSCAMLEYPTVRGGTTVGNILQACRRCNTVTGGSWECTEKAFFDCNSVGGDYHIYFPNTTGIAFYREANEGTWSGIASYGKGEITGGKSLLVVHGTVTSTNTISLTGATISTTAESGNLIESPTEGSIPVIDLRNNVATGPKALKLVGTFAQADGNTWYGALESRGALLTAGAQTFTTGAAEATYGEAVCAGGGGGGGGGSAAKEGSPTATQTGGGGGGAGQLVTRARKIAANTTLTVDEIGAGGKGGKGGAASTNNEGHAGEAGGNGGTSKLKGGGSSLSATGGKGGAAGAANSAANVNGGGYAQQGGLTSGTTAAPVGWGGVGNSATGFAGGQAMGLLARAGGGGAPASNTEGGVAGSSNSVSAKTGTKNGGHPEAAPVNTGQGGDGGGGGAPAGEGGEGGEGASGFVLIWKIS